MAIPLLRTENMNTTKLKPFAQQARKILMEGVRLRLLFWGFDGKDNDASEPEAIPGGVIFRNEVYNDPGLLAKWQQMKTRIGSHTFADAIEEAAYTWFNRLMAIKILEKNGYEQKQLDYEGTVPALLDNARNGIMPFLGDSEKQKVRERLLAGDEEGAFGILLTGYCRKNPLLNRVFGGIDDFTELLLPNNLLTKGGIIELLNLNGFVLVEDYKQVELIGWLYQFYISDKKDEVFKGFKENKKARKEDIPAATQIFTPKWIVKYLVENTVGQTWLDQHPDSEIKTHLKYLVENDSKKALSLGEGLSEAKTITLLDPAVGSGHILVTAFDVYMLMYKEEGSTTRQAVREILKYTLFGLDIDKRAAQLARFAVLMKAASHDRGVLSENVLPHIYAMPEPVHFDRRPLEQFLYEGETLDLDKDGILKDLNKGLLLMRQAQNLGSIIQFDLQADTRNQLKRRYKYWSSKEEQNQLTLDEQSWWKPLSEYLNPLTVLLDQYACVAANPPYISSKHMNGELKDYTIKYYEKSKSDLFAVFMELCWSLCTTNGRAALINQHAWMFLVSFEQLRAELLSKYEIESMLHLGTRTFSEMKGEKVQSTAFVTRKTSKITKDCKATYYNLQSYKSSDDKEKAFKKKENQFRQVPQSNFARIPGQPVAYWANETDYEIFSTGIISDKHSVRKGIDTGDNNKFLRHWFEVNKFRYFGCSLTPKWLTYIKGGEFQKWYGNLELVVDWEKDGFSIKQSKKSTIRNLSFQKKEAITWSLTGSIFGARIVPANCIFDNNGSSIFPESTKRNYILGLLNTKVTTRSLAILNPTLAFQVGDIARVPLIEITYEKHLEKINSIVEQCIGISKEYYDSNELSFDFVMHSLIKGKNIQENWIELKSLFSKAFLQLHALEEELNKEFIKIYRLEKELNYKIQLHEITLLRDILDFEALEKLKLETGNNLVPIRVDLVIQQFISYSIGLLMGRYRLDKPGLNIAHPEPSAEELSSYKYNGHQFVIDEDAIIPLLGEESPFADNLVKRFKDVLVAAWGEETQTENINFLNECLGIPFEKFLTEKFWDYHKRVYQKKPIYWLFTSPAGSFKVLVYMHRMDKFTVQKIRLNYLHRYMEYLGNEVQQAEANGTATRTVDKLNKALQDCREYDKILKPLADQQIVFDLDDGVTVNYAKFKPAVAILK